MHGLHNQPPADNIFHYSSARHATKEQNAFVMDLIKDRTSTPSILENLGAKSNVDCRLISWDIMNMRQTYRQKQRGGIPEIEALI